MCSRLAAPPEKSCLTLSAFLCRHPYQASPAHCLRHQGRPLAESTPWEYFSRMSLFSHPTKMLAKPLRMDRDEFPQEGCNTEHFGQQGCGTLSEQVNTARCYTATAPATSSESCDLPSTPVMTKALLRQICRGNFQTLSRLDFGS